jgi:hypothetical protein
LGAEQIGLPREQHAVEFGDVAGDGGELGAAGDEGGFEVEAGGNAVAVGFDAVLKGDLGGRERGEVGARTAGERLRVAAEALAKGGEKGRGEAGVAFAEIDLAHDAFDGVALFGGVGDVEEHVGVADLERRDIELAGLVFAPVPDGVENAETASAEAFGFADAPVVFVVAGEPEHAGFDLAAALLVEPVEAVELGEFVGEDVAEGGEVPDVERGVIEQIAGEGTFGPVGFLSVLIEDDPEVLFEEGGETDARAVEELGGEHRVKDALGAETAEIGEQADVEVAAVHEEVLGGEFLPERSEGDGERGGEHIDEEDFAVGEELEQAHAGAVVIHVVGLGIEGDLVHAVEGGEQGGQLIGLVDEGVVGNGLLVQRDEKETGRRRGRKREMRRTADRGRRTEDRRHRAEGGEKDFNWGLAGEGAMSLLAGHR